MGSNFFNAPSKVNCVCPPVLYFTPPVSNIYTFSLEDLLYVWPVYSKDVLIHKCNVLLSGTDSKE